MLVGLAILYVEERRVPLSDRRPSVSLFFSPGFTLSDATSWQAVVTPTGTMEQKVRRCAAPSFVVEQVEHRATLDPDALQRFFSTVQWELAERANAIGANMGLDDCTLLGLERIDDDRRRAEFSVPLVPEKMLDLAQVGQADRAVLDQYRVMWQKLVEFLPCRPKLQT